MDYYLILGANGKGFLDEGANMDFNTFVEPGLYSFTNQAGGSYNSPITVDAQTYVLIVFGDTVGRTLQLVMSMTNRFFIRQSSRGHSTWYTWKEL